MWFIPPPNTAPTDAVSTKTRGNSGINGDQLRRRYENVSFVERGRGGLLPPPIPTNPHIPRWNRGLCIVIWSFHWYTYLMFFTLCPISVCMPYLLGQTREVGVVCVTVCWCIHGAEESGVHMMNEIVRKQWIYGYECSHPFSPAVPGCPQGHRAPPGPILGGSLGIPPLLLLSTAAAAAAAVVVQVSDAAAAPPPSLHVQQW